MSQTKTYKRLLLPHKHSIAHSQVSDQVSVTSHIKLHLKVTTSMLLRSWFVFRRNDKIIDYFFLLSLLILKLTIVVDSSSKFV